MYKKLSQNQQRAAAKVTLRSIQGVPGEYERLSVEERRRILVTIVKLKHKEVEDVKVALDRTRDPRKRDTLKKRLAFLGGEKFALQQELAALRPKIKGPHGVRDCYIDAAREILGEFAHRRIMKRANEIFEEMRAEQGRRPKED